MLKIKTYKFTSGEGIIVETESLESLNAYIEEALSRGVRFSVSYETEFVPDDDPFAI